MSSKVFIVSTMTNSVSYCNFRNVGGVPTIVEKVTIRGGANLPSLRSGFGDVSEGAEGQPMWTARGVVTPISEAQYELLKNHELFKLHEEKGYVSVINRDIEGNHKAVKQIAANMEAKDDFAQLTPESLKAKVGKQIKIMKQEDDLNV